MPRRLVFIDIGFILLSGRDQLYTSNQRKSYYLNAHFLWHDFLNLKMVQVGLEEVTHKNREEKRLGLEVGRV